MWVQCFVKQIPEAGSFSIQPCAVGDESPQEYTQLNAFLLCVSDFERQWGQWSRGDNGGRWWQLAECIRAGPVNLSQVPTSERFLIPLGGLKQQEEEEEEGEEGGGSYKVNSCRGHLRALADLVCCVPIFGEKNCNKGITLEKFFCKFVIHNDQLCFLVVGLKIFSSLLKFLLFIRICFHIFSVRWRSPATKCTEHSVSFAPNQLQKQTDIFVKVWSCFSPKHTWQHQWKLFIGKHLFH